MLMTRSTDQASRSLANVDALVEKADPHWLAEDRVPIEPVWAAKSLLSGKITGMSNAIDEIHTAPKAISALPQ